MIDIEKLAREAGADYAEYGVNCIKGMQFYNMASLERFAALVLEQAAMKCKEIQDKCEGMADKGMSDDCEQSFVEGELCGAEDCAEAIRAMKPKDVE